MNSVDTISTPGNGGATKEKRVRKPVARSVRTVLPWDYQLPYRFVSSRPAEAETLVVVMRGRIGLLLFPASGKLVQTIRLGGAGEKREYRVPAGTYFTLITLVNESAVLEVRPTAVGVRPEWLPDMPIAQSAEARALWRKWFDYFQNSPSSKV